MFFHTKQLWIVSLHPARINFPTISKSCHCIMGKCLLWLRAEGRVQGLRSVTSSHCLSFITTLKTPTRPWFFFFLEWTFLNPHTRWWHRAIAWLLVIVSTLCEWRKSRGKTHREDKCRVKKMWMKGKESYTNTYTAGNWMKTLCEVNKWKVDKGVLW